MFVTSMTPVSPLTKSDPDPHLSLWCWLHHSTVFYLICAVVCPKDSHFTINHDYHDPHLSRWGLLFHFQLLHICQIEACFTDNICITIQCCQKGTGSFTIHIIILFHVCPYYESHFTVNYIRPTSSPFLWWLVGRTITGRELVWLVEWCVIVSQYEYKFID